MINILISRVRKSALKEFRFAKLAIIKFNFLDYAKSDFLILAKCKSRSTHLLVVAYLVGNAQRD